MANGSSITPLEEPEMKARLGARRHPATYAAMLATLAAVTASLTLGASPALADHEGQPEGAGELAQLIAQRVNFLNAAINEIQSKPFLGSDATTLTDHMQADISGLQQLAGSASAETSEQQLRSDREVVFTQYRVYHLVVPVANLFIETDYLDNVQLPDLNQDLGQLRSYVNQYNEAEVGPFVNAAQDEVGIATTMTTGLSTQLLSYTPAQWDANHSLLAGPRANLKAATKALQRANEDVTKAERYLSKGIQAEGDQGNQQKGNDH
jgi:hypothetical protein